MSSYKGRGALSNAECRFHENHVEEFDDGWGPADSDPQQLKTTVTVDSSKTILTKNTSPDVPFEQSINAYRGCEHGCIYCFARPTHAYLGMSPGLDFESRLIVKPDAAILLRKQLDKKTYRCRTIAMGTNTDPYQPIERRWKITRQILQVLLEYRHPVSLVTKSSLIERDLDILKPMAARNLVSVMISISTLDRHLARQMEPRAAAPQRRLETIKVMARNDIPVGVIVAPVIPVLNDGEIETIIEETSSAGATSAGYVMLRLPLEVSPLFEEWLNNTYSGQASHVMSMVRAIRKGKVNDARFGLRMKGQGYYADMIGQRFELSCKRHKLNQRAVDLSTRHFRRGERGWRQTDLFQDASG